MASTTAYKPTKEDLYSIIRLLHDNGVEVRSSAAAYRQLKAHEGNPSFCILLAAVFEADVCPLPDLSLPVSWAFYRQLAGITLKNNLLAAQHALGEAAIKEAARCALQTLCNPSDPHTARAAAQIVVKVTALSSFDWWNTAGLGDLANILLNELLPVGGIKTLSGLYALQYLMEDMPKQIGMSSKSIIVCVSQLATTSSVPLELRKAAFRMCFNIYEQFSASEWDVDTLSPLQEGLAGASWDFANTCTFLMEQNAYADDALLIIVFRSCFLMLDYFGYFPQLTPHNRQRMEQCWTTHTLHIIASEVDNHNFNERRSAAIDLITGILEVYDTTAGEGGAAFLIAPLETSADNIRSLVQTLVYFSLMSEDEVANIMESDDYRAPDVAAGISKANASGNFGCHKDLAQDELLDEGEAAVSLRRSALRCINALCFFSSTVAFEALMGPIKELWGNPAWRAREAGIVLVGTMASGCAVQLRDALDAIVDQLIQFISNPDEHVCVSSIAIWSLSRLIDAIVLSAPRRLDAGISSIISCLQRTSKRVQYSSVSAVKSTYIALQEFGMGNKMHAHMSELLEALHSCLRAYISTNLMVLIDICIFVMGDLSGSADATAAISQLDQLGSALKQESNVRARSFHEAYTNCYINEVANVLVSKDVFSLHRGLIQFLSLRPDPALGLENLKVWCGMLGDLVARDIHDDVDLVCNTVSLCSGYANLVPTLAFQQWAASNPSALTSPVLNLLHKGTNQMVQTAAASFLELLIRTLGELVLSSETREPLLTFITNLAVEEDDAMLQERCLKLAAALLLTFKHSLSSSTIASVLSSFSHQVLRSDIFGETQYLYVCMAYTVCQLFANFSSFFESFCVNKICGLMVQAPNDINKSEATIHLCTALTTAAPAQTASCVESVVPLFFSWQSGVGSFPGTHEALKNLLHYLTIHCNDGFQRCLRSYPQQAANPLMDVYI